MAERFSCPRCRKWGAIVVGRLLGIIYLRCLSCGKTWSTVTIRRGGKSPK